MKKFKFANMNIIMETVEEEIEVIKLLKDCGYSWSSEPNKEFRGAHPDARYFRSALVYYFKTKTAGYDWYDNIMRDPLYNFGYTYYKYSTVKDLDEDDLELLKKLR